MVNENESACLNFGGYLKYYDKILRIVRTKKRKTKWVTIFRLRCPGCGILHRELPNFIFSYKQYESEVIQGVLEELITCET